MILIQGGIGAEEIPFTVADRERLVRIELSLKELDKRQEEFRRYVDKRLEEVDKRLEELRQYVDKRFEEIDKRFDQMMTFLWILSAVFVTIVALVIGFALWDRRSMIRQARREAVEEMERSGKIKDLVEAFRELGKRNKEVTQILEKFRLM
jgi:DNA repair exonuclease SbcCD ATPase subunit